MDNKETAIRLKQRIQREDDLINQRTNLFLIINGLGATAVGLGSVSGAKYLIVLVAIILNGFWFILSIQCLVIIFILTKTLIDLRMEDDLPEQIVQKVLGRSLIFRPNAILNIYIPMVITVAWIVAFWHLK
jgi:hypothetical protein